MTTAADVNWSLVEEIDNHRRKVHSLEAQFDEMARSCLRERDGRLKAEAALLTAASVEPVAWRLVPIEPDEKMRREGESAASFGIGKPHDDEAIRRVWQWMVRAAPQVSRDDSVAVPRADLKRVVEIAGRNEASPEIDRLRSILEAHKEPT